MSLKAVGGGRGRNGGKGRRRSEIGGTAGTTVIVGLLMMVQRRRVERVGRSLSGTFLVLDRGRHDRKREEDMETKDEKGWREESLRGLRTSSTRGV